jgi:hypothetical protein
LSPSACSHRRRGGLYIAITLLVCVAAGSEVLANPARNDAQEAGVPNSRHQYGDAADITPTDLNGDDVVDSQDRDLLYNAALKAGFNEVIKKNITVHMAHE